MKRLKTAKRLFLVALSSLLGLHVIVVVTEDDKRRILEASEFQPNDVY